MSRSRPRITFALAASLLAIPLAFVSTAHADEPAVEDQWWQADGRDRTGYFEAGVEVVVDDGNREGDVGEAGNVELTTGFWFAPYAAAEIQLAVGRAVNPGVLSDTRVSSTHGGVGAGLRLALPIRISPVVAAHIGYRQVLDETARLTCGAECGNRTAVAIDHAPDQLVFADTEAGFQLNLGAFSVTAMVEYTLPLTAGQTTEVMGRADPNDPDAPDFSRPEPAAEVGVNLQAGVRF